MDFPQKGDIDFPNRAAAVVGEQQTREQKIKIRPILIRNVNWKYY